MLSFNQFARKKMLPLFIKASKFSLAVILSVQFIDIVNLDDGMKYIGVSLS